MTPEERLKRIERAQEFLTESHKQFAHDLGKLTATEQKLADDLIELTAITKRTEQNLDLLHTFMSESAQRQEAHVERMSNALQNLIRLFEDHARDGHGGEE